MRQFKDTEGRPWPVVINVGQIKRVRDLLKVDIYGLFEDQMAGLEKLLNDPCKFVDVLYVLCQAKAEEKGVTDIQFGESFGGDTLELARNAFLEELADFFPQAKAKTLRKLLAEIDKASEAIQTRAAKEIEQLDGAACAEKWIASRTTVPGSSASTPTPSR